MPAVQEQEQPLIQKHIEEPGELARSDGEKKELEGYLERVERQPGSTPVQDDKTGQAILTPSQSQTAVMLPLTDAQIKQGLHHKIGDAIRWLAEWCVRMAKKQWIRSQP